MKNKTFLISAVVIALFIFFVSCDNHNPNSIVNNISVPSNFPGEHFKKFPDREYIRSVASSVLKFSCDMYSHGKIEKSWESHCCLYSNNGDLSYLALPTHCFPYDSTKQYWAQVTDFEGKITILSLVAVIDSKEYDAAILVVKKIKGLPTLCEREIIAKQQITRDSAVLLVPFNARDVYQKFGSFLNSTKMEMSTLVCEPGDSGGLLIGRDGVIGIEVASDNNGRISHFVPINIFEDLYGSLVNEKKALD
jgi:hypothetical protein